MTDKELQKLKRAELLEIMLNLQSENDRLKSENEKLKLAVNERSITLQDAGNIAEAALQLNGVFKAAQEAADVYIENIRKLNEQKEKMCNEAIKNAENEAGEIIAKAESYNAEMQEKALEEYNRTINEAKNEQSRMINDTNARCLSKIKEIQDKCNAISTLDNQIAAFFNNSIIEEAAEKYLKISGMTIFMSNNEKYIYPPTSAQLKSELERINHKKEKRRMMNGILVLF